MSEPLYKVDARMANIFVTEEGNEVDKTTGEVLDTGTLDGLKMAKEQKMDNILCLIKNLKASADACEAESKKLLERAAQKRKRIEWLEVYLSQHMIVGETFESVHGVIRYSLKPPKVDIEDEDEIPSKWKVTKTKVTESWNKKGMREAMMAGVEIPGASLTRDWKMDVR